MDAQEIRVDLAVIGGSGLYQLDGLGDVRRTTVKTPYGEPSDAIVTGTLGGLRVAFLPRHGGGHTITPSNVPARANIYALKSLGARVVLAVSAVGSLREDFAPGDLVVADQIVDRTRGQRDSTFFDRDLVVHVPFADPYCTRLRPVLAQAAGEATDARVHGGGTYCCMEGPQFSTRAESLMHRALGFDLIGMTAVPEAKLAREAELCYVGLALVTDYDCWRDGHDDVTATTVSEVMRANGEAAKATIRAFTAALDVTADCACRHALATSIITAAASVPSMADAPYQRLVAPYL
jgi:5'-methylthioadenosine phosphorylase